MLVIKQWTTVITIPTCLALHISNWLLTFADILYAMDLYFTYKVHGLLVMFRTREYSAFIKHG